MRRERSILINATPEAVYDYVSDIRRHPEWTAQRIEIEHTGGPANGVGSEYLSSVHFVANLKSTIKVLEAARPQRFGYQCRDSSGRYNWAFDIRGEGTGTRLTQSFDRLDAPFYIKLLQPVLLYPLMGKGMFDKGLAGIKAHLEGTPAATGA